MKLAGWLACVVLVVAWLASSRMGAPDAVGRAERAEARADSLGTVSDSLRAIAVRQDTVVVTVLDSVRVVVERERIVQIAVVDTLRATLDSAQAVMLDDLVASHAVEVAALETKATEALLWGESWRETAEAMQAENAALRLSSQAWEDAARAQGRRAWYERGAALLAIGVLALR